jgi:hypothetical protein
MNEHITAAAFQVLTNASLDRPLTVSLPPCRTPGGAAAVVLSLKARGLLTRDGGITESGLAVLAGDPPLRYTAETQQLELDLEV